MMIASLHVINGLAVCHGEVDFFERIFSFAAGSGLLLFNVLRRSLYFVYLVVGVSM